MTATMPVDVDGVTDLPAGTIAAVVTFLRRDVTPLPRCRRPSPVALTLVRGSDVARYRAIYRVLGERWLWWSRLALPVTDLAAILDDPLVEAYAVHGPDGDIGLLEIDCRDPATAELAFLGLYEGATGLGIGPWLITRALERARALGRERIFVHTCTFDDPRAVGFYRRMGFVPFKFALDVTPDPRLSGVLSPSAGANVPVIG